MFSFEMIFHFSDNFGVDLRRSSQVEVQQRARLKVQGGLGNIDLKPEALLGDHDDEGVCWGIALVLTVLCSLSQFKFKQYLHQFFQKSLNFTTHH